MGWSHEHGGSLLLTPADNLNTPWDLFHLQTTLRSAVKIRKLEERQRQSEKAQQKATADIQQLSERVETLTRLLAGQRDGTAESGALPTLAYSGGSVVAKTDDDETQSAPQLSNECVPLTYKALKALQARMSAPEEKSAKDESADARRRFKTKVHTRLKSRANPTLRSSPLAMQPKVLSGKSSALACVEHSASPTKS